MTELFIEPYEDLPSVHKKISEMTSSKVTVYIPAASNLARVASLKLIRKEAEKAGKTVIFASEDPAVRTMIDSIPQPNQSTTFMVGKDVAEEDEEEEPPVKEVNIPTPVGDVRLHSLTRKDKKNLRMFVTSRGIFLIIVAFITVLAGMFLINAVYTRLHRAEITIVLKKHSINKSYDITATPKATVIDYTAQRIPAVLSEVTESASVTVKTSGKQFVGDKATGKITIYNKTDSDIELPRGTMITRISTSNGDFIYYTDEVISIPQRKQTSVEESGVAQQTTVFGKGSVAVTASEIGEEYNLKKGEKFSISDYTTNSYAGENEDDLTGGTKREAVVVTQSDLDGLLADLNPKVIEKAKASLVVSSQNSGVTISENTIATTVLQTVFDKKVGDVGDEVTLTMQVKATAYSYKEEDLKIMIEKLLTADVHENLELTKDNNIAIENVRVEADELRFVTKVTDNVVTRVDADKLKETFAGKSISSVQQYLTQQNSFASFVIVVTPKLPFKVQKIPTDYNRITIKVNQADETP